MPTTGRTPLFRAIGRALKQARFLAAHPELGEFRRELPDLGSKVRRGDPVARRDFLRAAALLGIAIPVAAGPFGRTARAAWRRPAARFEGEAVAILGAGAAGLTAAYRLMQSGIPCELFEGSERVGGRIYTLENFNQEKMFCELGAELVDTVHEDLIALAGELEVDIQDLKEGDAGVDWYHFGGRIFSEADLIPKFEALAAQIAADQAILYTDETEAEWTDAGRALDRLSIAEYLAKHAGKTEKWIIDLLNIAYTGEYGRDTSEQSALNLLTYMDPDLSEGFKIFGESDESKRVKGGNSVLMNALAKAIEGKVPLHPRHVLSKISDDGNAFTLAFRQPGGATVEKRFGRAICTLPFTTLREVEGIDKLGLDAMKLRSIKELGYGTNVKVMYGFSEQLWRTKPPEGRPASNGSFYTELPSQCFWETSRKQIGKSGILTNFTGGANGLRPFNPERFAETLADLDKIVPGLRAKHDDNRRSFLWPRHEFSKGAYSCQLVGQVTTVWEATAGTEVGGRLLFAGEHTSADFGGFMNGSIESGNRCAAEVAAAAAALPK